jgi:hypothetical protein
MKGQPIAAKMGQDHAAHIAVKSAFLASPQMQGTNDPTVAVGQQLLKANIAEHKVLMFAAQVMMAAQQAGLPPQSEQVQGQIAQQMLAASAAAGGPAGPSLEQQMLELNKAELDVARERIKSQDIREAAKIGQKDRELDLKALDLIATLRKAGEEGELKRAQALLDLSDRLAQNDAARLSAAAEGQT